VSAACDVAVLGLGATGSAALYHLARSGLGAIGIERFESPHAFGSSHGGSRIIREAYFEDPRYVPLVQRAYEAWAALERDSGRTLMLTTGGVMIGPREGELVSGALRSALAHDLPHELLDAAAIRRRFAAFRPSPDMVGVWEPRAGFLFPEQCIAAHLDLAVRHGAVVRSNELASGWAMRDGAVEIETTRGTIRAQRLVLASGAWITRHLGGLELPLEVERVVQAWFEPAANPEQLAPGRCPIAIWEYEQGRFFYAFPMLGGTVKAALHHQGSVTDPDLVQREVGEAEIGRIRAPMDRLMPGASGPLKDARACMYTNTTDGHFIIDRHPEHPQVLIASVCSGHGFKFASALGSSIARLVRGEPAGAELDLFRLGRFASRA